MPIAQSTDGARIRYESTGSGDRCLVLIHGQGGSFRNWDLNTAPLAAADLRVITPEIRPHRHTEIPPGADLSMSRLAQDVKDVLEAEGIDNAHVGGWSLGGLVAQQLAHDHPASVRSLILVNTFANWRFGPWYRPLAYGLNILALRLVGALPRKWKQAAQRKTVRERLIKQRVWRDHPQVCETFETDLLENSVNPDLNRLILGTTAKFNSRPWLGQLTMPALLIAGGRDHVPVYMPEDMHRLLPHSEMAYWPDGTHMIPWDYPEVFNREVGDFTSRAESGEIRDDARRDYPAESPE